MKTKDSLELIILKKQLEVLKEEIFSKPIEETYLHHLLISIKEREIEAKEFWEETNRFPSPKKLSFWRKWFR